MLRHKNSYFLLGQKKKKGILPESEKKKAFFQ